MRIVIYILLAIIMAAFQSTVGRYMLILNAGPNLLLAMVICVAILRGSVEGGFMGVICGVLTDCLSISVIGLNGLIYLYVGVLCGLLCSNLYRDKVFIAILFSAVSSFCASLLYYVFTHLLWGFDHYDVAFLNHILPETLSTIIYAMPVFYMFKLINNYFFIRRSNSID